MTSLKRSFLGLALYLAIIFVLAQADYLDRPIINFASYFYLAVMISIPVTLFFPFGSKVPPYVILALWAGIYLVMLQVLDRSVSTKLLELPVVILEFLLLEIGVWLAHQIAIQISHAETFMDTLALGAFPHHAKDIDSESERIKTELMRSRRYHRPLGLIVILSETDDEKLSRELLKSIQDDLVSHFTFARVGQIIDDRVRQTDVVMRDRAGRFVILCPETDLDSATMLAIRIAKEVKKRMDLIVRWGAAAFPDEALTFEDLLQKARTRSAEAEQTTDELPFVLTE